MMRMMRAFGQASVKRQPNVMHKNAKRMYTHCSHGFM